MLKMLIIKLNVQITYNMVNYASFLFSLNQETWKHIRTIENTDKKIIKCQLAIPFNHACLNENI